MEFSDFVNSVNQGALALLDWTSSAEFYIQLSMILVALVVAYVVSSAMKRHAPMFARLPEKGHLLSLRQGIFKVGELIFPLFSIVALSIANELAFEWLDRNVLTRICLGVAILMMIYSVASRFVSSPLILMVFKWGLMPIAALQIFGLLDETTTFLDRIHIVIGNIRISAAGVLRVLIFGSILFWLGRLSNQVGTEMIRSQEHIEQGTREVFAKLFEVALYMLIFVLLLQVMGVNLTALAVFGGALGVGLGFGLQSIASNFISGIIILLDRSVSVGDYIELEDGRTGTIRELNMRSTLLETFDGKDIMVPNEQFIVSSFVNWTHKDRRQRYSLNFSVAYDSDIQKVVDIVKPLVASHPQVIAGPELEIEFQPDCEICSFGDSGVEMLVEWWMVGIDDGKNRVGGDLLLMIFNTLRENGIVIPFPQREVKILGEKTD
jgi:small-conductance mechanosensitive channel